MHKLKNFDDVLDYITNHSPLTATSKKDYASAVKRLPSIMRTNRLADISADLNVVKAKLYYRKYDRNLFKSIQAYHAWRRKVLASLKLFLGILDAERANRKKTDGWTQLQAEANFLIAGGQLDLHINALIPLAFLTKIARKDDCEPWKINNNYLVKRSRDLPSNDLKKFRTSVRLIEHLQVMAPKLENLLPTETIKDFEIVRRARLPIIPKHLLSDVDAWIWKHGKGEVDPISGEVVEGMSAGTMDGYRNSFRCYLSHAENAQLLAKVSCLKEALEDTISVPVMQSIFRDTGPKQRLSNRTRLQYLESVARLAKLEGISTPSIKKALALNRDLKKGKAERRKISVDSRIFCAWLLSDRANEMLFRSIHIRLQKRALRLMDQLDSGRRMKRIDQQVVQAGTLAAMAAIWLWGSPLRINNMVSLRLYGAAPQIFLPKGKRAEVVINIALEETKNNRPIDHKILPAKHRAIEVLKWYIENIRPLIPGSENSIYLFPSPSERRNTISDATVRVWLRKHAVDEGLQIKPQQFRHGAASLYIRAYPGAYDHVAQLLDDKADTVRRFYAWIDDAAVMTKVQANVLKIAGITDAASL